MMRRGKWRRWMILPTLLLTVLPVDGVAGVEGMVGGIRDDDHVRVGKSVKEMRYYH